MAYGEEDDVARRLFTREEASELLPRIVPLVEHMRSMRRRIAELDEITAGQVRNVRRNGHGVDEGAAVRRQTERDDAVAALQRGVSELQALGCEIKDFELGLVDFPSEREGRVVYLCWKLGEPAVGFWHEVDAGYGGRRPL
ncbi:MAG: DUF2203 domain-containing protein [Chloroflexi bacterium]|nr:DUF2203 domain-containing protein [Chloroflexota bacterium]MBI4503890.1 DUF2203 domain-containing protein [Chloroflexota bacterium]